MMNKTITTGIIITIVIVAGYFIFSATTKKKDNISQDNQTAPEVGQPLTTILPVNKQAAFAIFTNGTFRVFTASMYHNLSDDVYIQADNPNIVQVKKVGVTWDDFFSTLPFKLTRDCLTTGTNETFCTGANGSLKFYLNDSLDLSALDKEIIAGDQFLVTFGKEDAPQIQKQMQQVPKL